MKVKFSMLGLLLVLMMTLAFAIILPSMNVDRILEQAYFTPPYEAIATQHLKINFNDPFEENGAHTIYPPVALAYAFQSLVPLRIYQFGFTLGVAILILWGLTHFQPALRSSRAIAVQTVIWVFALWLSVPVLLNYSVQVNGMTAGMLPFLIGLFLFERRPKLAIFLMGSAYTFKGQFLAFFPVIVAYQILMVDSKHPKTTGMIDRFLLRPLQTTFLFFLPSTGILAVLWRFLDLYPNPESMLGFALQGPVRISEEVHHLIRLILTKAGVIEVAIVQEASDRRSQEFSGFGMSFWAHFAIAWTTSIGCFGSAVYAKIKKQPVSHLMGLFGLCGILYLTNYTFIWRYPYWYNTFPIVWLNLLFVPLAIEWVLKRLPASFASYQPKIRLAVTAAFLLVATAKLSQFTGKFQWPTGDGLTPYPVVDLFKSPN